MFLDLLKFEWLFYRGRVFFPFAALAFAALGFSMTGRLGGDPKTMINAAYSVIPIYLLLCLGGVVLVAFFAGTAVLRDQNHRTEALVFSSGIGEGRFLVTRFLGLVGASFVVLSCAGIGILLRAYLPYGLEGPFQGNDPFMHLRILIVYVLPNILIIATGLYAVALLGKNRILTYASGLAVYVLYLLAANYAGSPFMTGNPMPADPELRWWAALLDPLALTPFFLQTESWTRGMRNTMFPAMDGLMLLNRTLWLSFSALVWAVVWRRFRFRSREVRPKQKPSAPDRAAGGSTSVSPYLPCPPRVGFRQDLAAWFSCLRLELAQTAGRFPFWLVMGLWAVLCLGEILPLADRYEFGAPILPLTSVILDRFQFDLLPLFGLLVLILFSGESMARERELNMDALIQSTPSRPVVFYMAKVAHLMVIPVLLITVAILIGVGFQISQGMYRFQIGLYLSLFLYGGLPLVLSAFVCVFFQAVCGNKVTGMVFSALFLFFFSTGLCAQLGLAHPMWRFAAFPNYSYSEMTGYRHFFPAFVLYMVYWSFPTMLSALFGFLLRPREGMSLIRRSRVSGTQGSLVVKLFVVVCGLGFALSGALIYYRTNILGHYRTDHERDRIRAAYETRFKYMEDLPQPSLQDVYTEMDLYPEQGFFRLRGRYLLANLNEDGVQEVLITMSPDLELENLDMESAVLLESEPDMGAYLFRFPNGLAPGSSTTLHFEVTNSQDAFSHLPVRDRVLADGTLIHGHPKLPMPGYIREYELSNPRRRQTFALGERTAGLRLESLVSQHHGPLPRPDAFVNFETLISTDRDQTAVAPGRLLRTWEEGRRRYAHFKSDKPIRNLIPYLSAVYQSRTKTVEGIEVELLYHDGHDQNLDHIMAGIEQSLAYCRRNFGPYPHGQLRFLEVSSLTGISGYAAPTLVLMGERGGFTHDLSRELEVDQVLRRAAHEVSHQWWGHMLAPADVEQGSMLLVETLARYTELMIMARVAGPEAAERFVDYESDRYFRGRAREPETEMPLIMSASDRRYLVYSKGAAAMFALSRRIGEERVNQALSRLLETHAYPEPPATALDLVRLLVAAAPEESAWIREWFEDVTYYRSDIERLESKPLENGRFQLEVDVTYEKRRLGNDGFDHAEPFNMDLEIAIVVENGSETRTLIQTRTITEGSNHLRFEVPAPPISLTLDPNRETLDQNRATSVSIPNPNAAEP